EPIADLLAPAPEWAIVAPVGGVLVPGIVRPDRPDRKPGSRPRRAVGSPPQPPQSEPPARRAAIAFALVDPDTSASKRYRDGQRPRDQQAFSPLPGSGTHPEQTDRLLRVNAALAAE